MKNFFRNVVRDAMDARERQSCIRPDMIHLLMLAKKGSLTYDTDTNYVDESDFAAYKETTKKEENVKRGRLLNNVLIWR